MTGTHLKKPGEVVCVLNQNDAKCQKDDLPKAGFGAEHHCDTIVGTALAVETVDLQNRQSEDVLMCSNGKPNKQSAKHRF